VRRKAARSSSSEYTGVSWNKRDSNWKAAITIRDKEGRRKALHHGHYENERDAALAYDRYASANHPS
jgi:hypothetical protein